MATNVPPWPGDFESVAQQYWSLWGDALRQVGAAPAMPMPGAAPGWQQTVDWWAQLVPGGQAQVDEAVGRFQRQASQWFGQMQQVAAQFTGRDHDATDIGRAWRSALGMAEPTPAHNPFADIFRSMQGGAHGLDGWMQQLRPWLENLQRDGDRWLHVPTFGLAREHQERWQHLAQAYQGYQQRVAEYDQLMLQVAQDAFARFERKLEEHAEPGRQLQNARALFDLWIDAAEEAYAQVALSEDFRHVFGGLANAQARLRLGVQREVEQVCTLFGMPTRTEVDSAHRKIVELERALRRVTRAQAAPVRRAPVQRAAAEPVEAPVVAEAPPPPAPRPAKPKAVKKRPPSRKPAPAAKAAPKKRVAAKKTAAKKPPRRAVAAAAPLATRQERAPAAAQAVARKPARARTPTQAVPKARVAKAPKKTAAPASKPASVVSMKDWVARNAARAATAQAPKAASKTKRGKGK
ncbi:class III poly(R)-hydroxyalkanoic acid synthase subunit PhaE [Pseudoxanthomonas sp. F37]|jgi:class III poly(R)-hydroxyalkanoic acid synthase PhaE subunit|uniref:class III poly(R)-hydroxyalkanoic acid synthase subunit PhaE n=1 Tax=Pseudoxanthomonas sp. F37 TaxID=2932492 RepID=UPI001FD0724A|nr:class III poly(R)-hydroxyalkanoic acid synthase subunit PhaE [Pseudoxanthomonas sp. F37]UOV10058.1 class III poly(R)-hydroxyalkanoic acid synthase subunit PhaE [Pseudoxanthomonas sp. F37]